ncbi:MAG: hypothetical protein LBL04_11185 [Bacteroidales bacterium]|nr:hypothetical protein [Bacteroidales bacterium]
MSNCRGVLHTPVLRSPENDDHPKKRANTQVRLYILHGYRQERSITVYSPFTYPNLSGSMRSRSRDVACHVSTKILLLTLTAVDRPCQRWWSLIDPVSSCAA